MSPTIITTTFDLSGSGADISVASIASIAARAESIAEEADSIASLLDSTAIRSVPSTGEYRVLGITRNDDGDFLIAWDDQSTA